MFDVLDRKLLDVLQDDVTLGLMDLAERVGSSKSVVWRRLQAYLDKGVIDRRVAVLNPKKVGYNVTVFALVKLLRHDSDAIPSFINAAKAIPQVQECHITLGQVDFLLKILVVDIDEYRSAVWNQLSRLGVHEVSSLVSFESSVSRTKVMVR